MSYDAWVSVVGAYLWDDHGMHLTDLPCHPYGDWWHDRVRPQLAALWAATLPGQDY